MQEYHSLLNREEKRDMFPYCRDAGMCLIPRSPLARGRLTRPLKTSKEQLTERQQTDHYSDWLNGAIAKEGDETICGVEALVEKKGVTTAQIAIAWSLKKGVNPILGLSSVERVDEAIAALLQLARDGSLTDEDVKYLEEPYVPKKAVAWSIRSVIVETRAKETLVVRS